MYVFLFIPIVAVLITFLVKFDSMKNPELFSYEYIAKTLFKALDHSYIFTIEKFGNGYKCYIERTPDFRGRNKTNYQDHYWLEIYTNRKYICWTGKIKHPEQAKTLCRNWADATQQFIDTGVPAQGFEG